MGHGHECVAGRPSPADASSTAEAAGFVPLGLIVRADDEAPAALSRPASSMAGPTAPDRVPPLCQATDERPGLMEIDLACGTRLRVDAFVNERALRRVLSVLKALA